VEEGRQTHKRVMDGQILLRVRTVSQWDLNFHTLDSPTYPIRFYLHNFKKTKGNRNLIVEKDDHTGSFSTFGTLSGASSSKSFVAGRGIREVNET
jgi:hypothetical protein